MDSAHHYSLSLLDKVQKRGIRLIEYEKDYKKRANMKVLMTEYGIGSLKERRDLQLLSFMYNESHIADNLNQKSNSLILRSSKKIKFKEKLTRKTTVLNSPYYRGISLWNNLTGTIQKIETLRKFKLKLKQLYPNRKIHGLMDRK